MFHKKRSAGHGSDRDVKNKDFPAIEDLVEIYYDSDELAVNVLVADPSLFTGLHHPFGILQQIK